MKNTIITITAFLIYIGRFVKRSRRFRTILITIAILETIGFFIIGPAIISLSLGLLAMALQFAMAMVFMVVQFVAIFWFMSQTKTMIVVPGDSKQLTFADYWGQDSLLNLMKEWLYLLKDRGKFKDMGGRPISGILLAGPPGTGKTYLAKAMAGEGGIAFIGMEASSFQAMFFGVGVLKVIAFFNKARKLAKEYGACIAYLDEIDAIGASRGGVQGGGAPMGMMGGMMGGGSMGTLTRLLYEMDGLGDMKEWDVCVDKARAFLGMSPQDYGYVLVMGATNRPDVLDPALLRPGRFDRTIQVDPPDKTGRKEIIKGYLGKIKHEPEINIDVLAADTAWATPAKIASAILKDAVRIAVFDGRDKVSQRDIEMSLMEQAMGLQNPISDLDPEQERQVAIHEAGHAVAQYYLNPNSRIVHLTITRRSNALGFMLPVPITDVYAMPLERYVADIMIALAGHVATELMMGKYWTGATGDLIAVRHRVMTLASYGVFGSFPFDGSLNADTQKRVDAFINDCMSQVRALLIDHQVELENLANVLLVQKDMSGEEVLDVIKAKEEL